MRERSIATITVAVLPTVPAHVFLHLGRDLNKDEASNLLIASLLC